MFFLNLAQVVRDLVLLVVDVRDNCRVVEFIEDLNEYCEDNCEGKKIMNRLMAQFSNLSKIYSEIMKLTFETKPETMMHQFLIIQDIGTKAGEFFRLAIGFSNWPAIYSN